MNALAQSREEIRAALEAAGITTFAYVPETISGTCAVIQTGSPFLTDSDEPFCDYRVTWLISLIIQVGTNERVTDDLDSLICKALLALNVSEVAGHFAFSDHSSTYLAANLTVTDNITIKE